MTVKLSRWLLVISIVAAVMPALTFAQAAKPTLEQRLQRVEDELAIRQVLIDYSSRQDRHDYDGYVALFAKNGEWVSGTNVYKGREAIKKMLVGLYGEPPPNYVNGDSFHISFNPEVTIAGDKATVRSRHLLLMRGRNGQPEPMLSGRYDDEFVREDGQWLIQRRVDTPVMPTSDEWNRIIRERRAGQ
ncbi:MAG TPA: nuclear transport factor 2 family protein [Candidatus Acidoferrum sp.]|nr:nuclear transport factor 2 family protein [Candidatus Acidoferrum sp.]